MYLAENCNQFKKGVQKGGGEDNTSLWSNRVAHHARY